MDVTNVVDANGMRYIIVCRANWAGSNCAPMTDGDLFPAEIDGTTMWISARKGGNQGKPIRIRYKILDIRQLEQRNEVASVPVAPTRPDIGEPLDNTEVVAMIRGGVKDDTIVYVIGVRPARYSLSKEDQASLRSAGASEVVIRAMLEKLQGR